MKKILSVALCLVLMFSAIPMFSINASAVADNVGDCWENPNSDGHSFDENGRCIYCHGKEFPIVGVVFDTNEVSIVENTCGSYNENFDYFVYDPNNHGKTPEYTAILKDGISVKSEWGRLTIDGEDFYLYADSWDMQYNNAWLAGNTYTVGCSFSRPNADYIESTFKAYFDITILENPIDRIEIADVTISEMDYWFDGEINRYNLSDLKTVPLNLLTDIRFCLVSNIGLTIMLGICSQNSLGPLALILLPVRYAALVTPLPLL